MVVVPLDPGDPSRLIFIYPEREGIRDTSIPRYLIVHWLYLIFSRGLLLVAGRSLFSDNPVITHANGSESAEW